MNQGAATIRSKNYDGSLRKSWKCQLVSQTGARLLFVGKFEHEISHPELGLIEKGTISHEYYWLGRWYNIFQFRKPLGDLRNYYCNVNMPPTYSNGILEYIDLDLDLLVWPDFAYRVLDREEFEERGRIFGYPQTVIQNAERALNELIQFAELRNFPLDQTE